MNQSRAGTAVMNASTLELGGRDPKNPEYRMLQAAHESFSRGLGTALSSLLQAEIRVELGDISLVNAQEFQRSRSTPSCLIRMQLHPRQERMILYLDCSGALGLLELLLGGKGGSNRIEPREPTEIEWSLLEEVVRVIARSLGEAWLVFHEVDFKVESLESDPARLPGNDPAMPLMQIGFTVYFGEQTASMCLAVPQTFFEMPAPAAALEAPENVPGIEEIERNLELLQDAGVRLEVSLEGPTMAFGDLKALRPGQVVKFDYPLGKQLRALVNGTVAISGQIVSSGRKRAFQVEELP
jgi:flagellar motor switch protein FliM